MALGLIKLKAGRLPLLFLGGSFSPSSRSMIVLQTLTQESQMNTLAGPAIIFRTSPCGFPQKEQKLILVALAIISKNYSFGFLEITSSTNPYSLASSADI